MDLSKSIKAFQKAQKVLPGGVNSPVRAFRSVKADPVFIDAARGAYVYDIDGNEYVDFVSSWGPMILGHANPVIVNAIKQYAEKGTSFGMPTQLETEVAELIIDRVPSIEKVRMVNSGTEATMSAIRLARGYTGRDMIIKFAGCFHGHGDSFLIKAGSGAMTFGLPDSPGVPESMAKNTLIAEFNSLESVQALFEAYHDQIAAIIVEPVAGNMGCIPPARGFLEGLRMLATDNNALLIFDEVMTGFRVSAGGAQELYGVRPDLTTLGKIIGGGLPVGAYGGASEIMDRLAPEGPVYQSGTLSGNPLAMAAGKVMLQETGKPGFYEYLEKQSEKIQKGLTKAIQDTGHQALVNRVGSMMTLFFNQHEQVQGFPEASASDTEMFARFFKGNLEKGIHLAPSQFECLFVSAVHTDKEIDRMLDAGHQTLKELH